MTRTQQIALSVARFVRLALLSAVLVVACTVVLLPARSTSAAPATPPASNLCSGTNPGTPDKPCIGTVQECGDTAAGAKCGDLKSTGCTGDCGLVQKYLIPVINLLSISVGVIVTIAIVIGGIQYAASEDDPQKVAAARGRIFNAVFAFLAFLFLYAFLQWVVPGGFL